MSENQAADALIPIFGNRRITEEKWKEMMEEAMKQASEDQRAVIEAAEKKCQN